MAEDISLTIEADEPPSETVIAAFTYPGMGGMIACNYLIEELDLEQTGYVQADGLPALAPFENGRPYHPTRLHSRSDLDVTVLTSELPVPLHATEVFGRELLDWILDHDIDEVAILLGVSGLRNVGSSDEIHYVASPDYTERRLQTADFAPLAGGFFDGITASLVSRAIDTPLRAGVLVTPTRTHGIDPDASLRLVEAVNELYELDANVDRLRRFATEIRDHYEQLMQRTQHQDQTREWNLGYM
ncbi:uncharacterized protein SAMN04488063_3162 [Halopelagius inordinatus]|uniref:Proteasome assembly chaperone family protein n=1 Tax=Halopelagius inordinatus TaxID=553467 RepID=A0A1I2VEU8_9EURY|nr:PAC2 family protein [Halopelagius inordinatus]SFG86969.1 uncharacterized protein SAMN04488063_3162 [Halopelagius inordinatus]